jgi:hypothetical protein
MVDVGLGRLHHGLEEARDKGGVSVWAAFRDFESWLRTQNQEARAMGYLVASEHPRESVGVIAWVVYNQLRRPRRVEPEPTWAKTLCDALWGLLWDSERGKLDPRIPKWPEPPSTLAAARNTVRDLVLFLQTEGIPMPYPEWERAPEPTPKICSPPMLDESVVKEDMRPDVPTVAYCLKDPATVRWAGTGPVKLEGSSQKLLHLLLGQLEKCRTRFKNTWRENFAVPPEALADAFPRAKSDVAARTISNRISELNDHLEVIAFPLVFSYVDGCVRLKSA